LPHRRLPGEYAGEDIYGEYVFGETAQRQYLAKPVFKKLRRTIEGHEPFDPAIADAVAQGVKEWPWPTAPPITPTGSCHDRR